MIRSAPLSFLRLAAIGLWASTAAAQEVPETIEELPPPADRAVDFATEIKPILDGRCVACHGPEKQKSGLRLDNPEDAKAGGDLGPAILPGESGESFLIHKVTGFDYESIMPPDGEPLTAEQVGLLRAWIDQGANWTAAPADVAATELTSDHWSFQPIERPEIPKVEREGWVRTPVDAFVLARLEAEGIAPSPEADRATLIRRLSFDLLGLPPTPEEVDAFVADESPEAYEKLVDRLLASPHYGERWGRHWLDLARYADSDGYEKDSPRPYAYRYRDWVIDAINDDLPFDEFTIEQLAGDLLPDATLDQKTAAGFHRNTLTNREGGVDQEEYRVAAVLDRVNTTGTVWLGLTVGCAQCHTHKYDPILQKEYYQLFAFFNTSDEADLPAPTAEEQAKYDAAKAEYDAAHAPLVAAVEAFVEGELPSRQAAWEAGVAATPTVWRPLEIVEATSEGGASLTVQEDDSILAEGAAPERDTYTIVGETELAGITAIRVEVLADDSLPGKGPGRAGNGNFVLSELTVGESPRYEGEQARTVGLAHPTADFSQEKWPVAAAIDGDPKTGWGVVPRTGKGHLAVFETDLNIGTDCGTRFTVKLDQQYGGQHTIGRFRLSVTSAERPVTADEIPEAVVAALAVAGEDRTDAQREVLKTYFRTIDHELARLEAAVAEHEKQQPKPPEAKVQTLAEQSAGKRRESHILIRGDFLRPGEPVDSGVLSVLHDLEPRGERADRLDLARWLMSEQNPLTARVEVNRAWYHLFGHGLVGTMEDFGTRGDEPTHPQLLDWLAGEFRRLGWSRKELIKTILMSSTYRQSSAVRPELMERDASNLLLARQNRVRLEAEVIRDASLAAAGLLSDRIGGPSVFPPQPKGISDLTYAGSARWNESEGSDRYRRGMYTFFRRTSPYPMLTTFDAPDATVCTVGREASNTPLQALTLLNDEVFVECARALGRSSFADSPCDCEAGRIEYAFRRCLGRVPTDEEIEILLGLYEDAVAALAADPEAAASLLGEAGAPEGVEPAEAAATVLTARAIMNLDEFITRE